MTLKLSYWGNIRLNTEKPNGIFNCIYQKHLSLKNNEFYN